MNTRVTFLTLVCLSFLISACGPESPAEEQIAAAISNMQLAAEERRSGDLLDYIAKDFVTENGNMGKRVFGQRIRAMVLANRDIGVSMLSQDIQVSGNHATVKNRILLTGGRGGWIPEKGRVLDVTSGWRIIDGEWRVIQASWKG